MRIQNCVLQKCMTPLVWTQGYDFVLEFYLFVSFGLGCFFFFSPLLICIVFGFVELAKYRLRKIFHERSRCCISFSLTTQILLWAYSNKVLIDLNGSVIYRVFPYTQLQFIKHAAALNGWSNSAQLLTSACGVLLKRHKKAGFKHLLLCVKL